MLRRGCKELGKEKLDRGAVARGFVVAACFGEGYGRRFQRLDNEVLRIKGLKDDELQEMVKRYA